MNPIDWVLGRLQKLRVDKTGLCLSRQMDAYWEGYNKALEDASRQIQAHRLREQRVAAFRAELDQTTREGTPS